MNCYPAYRTLADRRMQQIHGDSCCDPSATKYEPCYPQKTAVAETYDSVGARHQLPVVRAAADAADENMMNKAHVIMIAPGWCGYSVKMSKQADRLMPALRAAGVDLIVLTDPEDDRYKDAVQKYGATAFPHSVVVRADGATKSITGARDADEYAKEVVAFTGAREPFTKLQGRWDRYRPGGCGRHCGDDFCTIS